MKRRAVSIVLFVILCVSVIAADTAFAASRDVSFEETLAGDLKTLGLFKGVSETDFALSRAPTRIEALVMLIRSLGREQEALAGTWSHPFTDVPAWADKYVGFAYQNGLTNGTSDTTFGTADASAAQYLTFVLRALGYSDGAGKDFTWDNPYALAGAAGIVPAGTDTGTFWRADVVRVSYAALASKLKGSEQTLAQKLIAAGAFTRAQYDAVYRADAFAAAASAGTGDRKLTAQEIAEKCSASVFYIETYGINGAPYATGSGFFIAPGLAVTNRHVVANAYDMIVRTTDGKTFDRTRIIDSDWDNDLALLKMEGANYPALELSEAAVRQGQQVYAIGSPLGLENTLSQGIVSNVKRTFDGTDYIQVSVPINHGSSGGALLDEYGRVIGVISAGYSDTAGDLNLAIPAGKIKGLDRTSTEDLFVPGYERYPGLYDALDFGALTGVRVVSSQETMLGWIVKYDLYDFYDRGDTNNSDRFAESMEHYFAGLENAGMELVTQKDNQYLYVSDGELVQISFDFYDGVIVILAEERVQCYERFPDLPDFGWYSYLPTEDSKIVSGSTMYAYRWRGKYTYDEFINLLSGYYDLLESWGFVYRGGENGIDLFEGNGLSVGFVYQDSAVFYIDVKPIPN